MQIKLMLPYPPSVNFAFFNRKGGGGVKGRGIRTVYRKFLEEVEQVVPKGVVPTSSQVRMAVRVYRPTSRGDIDNRLKAIIDSLKGLVYIDDVQVVNLEVSLHTDRRHRRVEVFIGTVEEVTKVKLSM